MISVTRLNGKPFVINAELIRTVEENPDTVITLVNGDLRSVVTFLNVGTAVGRSLR